MNAEPSRGDVERFRALIAKTFGLHFDESRGELLDEVLRRRLSEIGQSARSYTSLLSDRAAAAELRELARELTVGETYFFRNPDQFLALSEVAIPERMRARASERRLSILSAGCASGEEPFTIAMVVRDKVPSAAAWTIDIRGIDVNPAALDRASKGRYGVWSLRETPAEIREKFFEADGREFVLDPTIRGMVTLAEENLLDEGTVVPGSFDVVFLRNVIMYFTPETMRTVVDRLARRKGLVTDEFEGRDVPEVLDLLFKGGLSTSENVSHAAGRGIGLDVVRDAVAELGGDVSIRTAAGQRTIVEVTVPVSVASVLVLVAEASGTRAAIPLDAVRQTIRLGPSDVARAADGGRIVHFGKSVRFGSLAACLGPAGPARSGGGSILESAGYEVDLATSAEDALEKAAKKRYGLFLVDIEMPGMDRFSFVEATRADPKLGHIPAVLVSSRDSKEDFEPGARAGAYAYLVKTEFDQKRFLEKIREVYAVS